VPPFEAGDDHGSSESRQIAPWTSRAAIGATSSAAFGGRQPSSLTLFDDYEVPIHGGAQAPNPAATQRILSMDPPLRLFAITVSTSVFI
jgi:hypothetical protein